MVATLLVLGVATLMALSLFNVDIRPILTGAGIAGLAVGFGAQNLVRDVIAGFFLILEDQVRLGDVVSINGKSGLVEAIRLRTIALRGHDGTVHVIPNGVITELSNMTKDFSFAVLDIGIPYEENVDAVVDVLRSVANELRTDPVHGPNILEPLEVLGVEAFGESSVLLRVRIKTVPIQQWNVGREFRRRIKMAFEARGIEFPSRPVTVRLEGSDRPRRATKTSPPPKKSEWTTPSSSRVRTAARRSRSTSSPTSAARSSRTARCAAIRGASASIAATVSATSISSEPTVPSRIARMTVVDRAAALVPHACWSGRPLPNRRGACRTRASTR